MAVAVAAAVNVAGDIAVARGFMPRAATWLPAMIKLEALSVEQPFRIGEIVRAPAPDGSNAVWHRYQISQGTNTITGLRAGRHEDVFLQVEAMVERLNLRRMGKKPK